MLCIEGDDDLRSALAEFVQELGFDAMTVSSAAEAFPLLEQLDFAVVLCDFRHGGSMDASWTAAEEIRRYAAPVPVGIATGWPLRTDEWRERGFAFLLRKPFDPEELFTHLGHAAGPFPVVDHQAQVIRGYFDALSRNDWDALAALCTEDVRYHLPGTQPRYCTTVSGREKFRDFSAETFESFADATFTVDSIVGLPWGAVARYVARWTAGGQKKELPGAVVFRFDGPLISEIGVRLDVRKLSAPSA